MRSSEVREPEAVLRHNVGRMLSSDFWKVAMTESVGGNAGRGCLAVNLEVEPSGKILYVGNESQTINATLRIYLPFPPKPGMRLRELIIEVVGSVPDAARERLTKATWLWNLHQTTGTDRPVIQEFVDGEVGEADLDELLRTKYPGRGTAP